MNNHILIKDSTANEAIESSQIRFFDTEWNITKMQNAVSATVNNQPADLLTACALYKKKMLIQRFKALNESSSYLDFRKIMETSVEDTPVIDNDMEYLFQLHKHCPDSQYLCLFFFNTVVADTSMYGYEDCMDIFKAYAKSNVQTYTLCYLKKKLTTDKLNTIIHNANTLGLNTHISISSFKKPRRITENLYCISSIIIDLDFYKTDYAELDYHDFRQALQPAFEQLGYEPSAITYSGHGYYLTFHLENNVNLKYPAMHWLYQSVVKKLIDVFAEYGADYACSDMTRVFKVPGSINFKTGNPVTLCYYNPTHTVNLSELADSLGIHTRNENKKRENAIAYEKYYYSSKSRFTHVNRQRMSDYERLLHIRDYKLPHLRDLFFLFVAINCFNSAWSANAVLSYCEQLNQKLRHPFPDKELQHLVYYLNDQLNEDGTCKLKYKNDHIVNVLHITDKEQESMQQLISCKTRAKRKKAWDKAHAHFKTLETKHNHDELFNTLMYYRYAELLTNNEIAATLDLDIRTVTSYIGTTPKDIKFQNTLFKKEYRHFLEQSTCYEIYLLKVKHFTIDQIASALNLSIRSIKRYISIMNKHHLTGC